MDKLTDKKIQGELTVHGNKVTIVAKEGNLLLLGYSTVGISTPGAIHFNSKGPLHIDASKVELGLEAEKVGEPVLLGKTVVDNLIKLTESLETLASALNKLSETQLETAIPQIVISSTVLRELCPKVREGLKSSLSSKTFTV